jgi:phosphate transport system protein
MGQDHTVKSFDGDLNQLKEKVNHMGKDVIQHLEESLDALLKGDGIKAQKVIEKDSLIDGQEHVIDTLAVRLIALRQPMARDLRTIVGILKISSHLERVGDYAVNISRRTLSLGPIDFQLPMDLIRQMKNILVEMTQDVLVAFDQADDQMAHAVWKKDQDLDGLYTAYVRQLLSHMMEDPRHMSHCLELLLVAKNIERAGDHMTDIAEVIHYIIDGQPFGVPRPHGQGISLVNYITDLP